MYEATQTQRKLERAIRKCKRQLIAADGLGDKDEFTAKSIRLRRLREYYKDFSAKTKLTPRNDLLGVSDFGRSISARAAADAKRALKVDSTRGALRFGKRAKNEDRNSGGEQKTVNLIDVTEEYKKNKNPKSSIVYDEDYIEKKHREEIKIANVLLDAYGGDIKLIAEAKVPNVKTPDYEWNGKLWELKEIASKRSVDNAARKGFKQIRANPGGIIMVCKDDSIKLTEIEDVIKSRCARSALTDIDIILLNKNNEVIKIIRYKK